MSDAPSLCKPSYLCQARERGSPSAEVLAYVREVSPQGDKDLLPGLVQFTEGWLEKVQHHENES
jgi:hypothetical protein